MIVTGIDPSLTGTGLARIVSDAGKVRAVATHTVGSEPCGKSVEARLDRLSVIVSEVAEFILPGSLVLIESPAYTRQAGARHERSGLWWLIARAAKAAGCRVVEVSPTARARYATGNGNPGKRAVVAAMREQFPLVPLADDNQADALALAQLGMRLVGSPIEREPRQHHLDAVAAVRGDI